MKTMKYISALLLMCLSFNGVVKAQNPAWILPPNYYKGQPYSLPTSPNGYNGDPATYASNMVLDANNNIQFFIVDGKIYNGSGILTGKIKENGVGPIMAGNSELPIVQDPGNCRRYYIFSLNKYEDPDNIDVHASLKCYYSVYDLDVQSNIPGSTVSGCLVTNGQILTQYPSLSPPLSGGGGISTYWAVSKLRDANTNPNRLIFINRGGEYVNVLKLDANGLSAQLPNSSMPLNGLEIPLPAGKVANYSSPYRSEMEVHEMPNGNYRIALTLFLGDANPTPTSQLQRVLTVFEVNHQATDIIPGSTKYFPFTKYGSYDPVIHGIEFSPNGRYIYFTRHYESQLNPLPQRFIECADYNTSSIIYLNQIPTSQATAFQNSLIEIGVDGKLYLATNDRLATIDDPNNPSTSSFTNNAVSLTNYQISNPVQGNPSTGLYLLPDQIDGQNYSLFTSSSPYYSLINYTAQVSGTWTLNQGQNPWSLTNKEVYIKDTLLIPSGKTVTIKNMTFHFGTYGKVIIKPGGKLVLDGTTFTNNSFSCNAKKATYWSGVQVYGHSNMGQYPLHHPTYQGMLVLRNKATISYAIIGAQNWKFFAPNTSGGVIRSYDGIFKNNQMDVLFYSYQNHFPNTFPLFQQNDLSTFVSTSFVSNNNFIEGQSQAFAHAQLYDVRGVSFHGCHFANYISGPKWQSHAPKIGIQSLNASYIVGTECMGSSTYPCPPNNIVGTKFDNLYTGVKADGAGMNGTVTVTQSDFNNVINGIFIDGINNVSVDRNTITLNNAGYIPPNSNPIQEIGVKISKSTGFTVEENDVSCAINPFTQSTPNSFGIVIDNSGFVNNRVYKNTLHSLKAGVIGYGVNYWNYSFNFPPFSFSIHSGLRFTCNNFSGNQFDIFVGGDPGVVDGINYNQGIPVSGTWKAAGNEFNHPNTSNTYWSLNDYLGTSIRYYYNALSSNEEPINSNGIYTHITKVASKIANSCPSSFNNGGIIVLPTPFFYTKMDSLNDVFQSVHYNYVSLMSDGNSKELQEIIKNSWSDKVWELRNKLLEKSPFLSAKTLLNVAKQQILPNPMLMEVLLANPDATRGREFIHELKEVTHYSIPDYIIYYIKKNKDKRTVRSEMESQMSALQAEISLYRNALKHRKMSKDSFQLAERLNTVQMGKSLSDKIGVLDYYVSQKKWNKAKNLFKDLKKNDTLKQQFQRIKNYGNYIDFRSNLGDKSLAKLDSSEISYLQELAEEKGRVGSYAQNILCFFYHKCSNDIFTIKNEINHSNGGTYSDSTLNEVLYKMSLSPNPTTGPVTLEWTIYDELQNARYKVQNLSGGNVIAQGTISENKGSVEIPRSTAQNGYYVVKIINNGKVKAEKKLVVK